MSGSSPSIRDGGPSPADFISYLPWACYQLGINTPVLINKITQADSFSTKGDNKKGKRNKSAILLGKSQISQLDVEAHKEIENIFEKTDAPSNAVKIWAIYDSKDNLIQLIFDKKSVVTRELLKTISVILPFQSSLQSITIKSRIDKYTIPEICKIVSCQNITDVCFDGAFVREGNFYLLFDLKSLRNVSLSRCSINDDIIKAMAYKLVHTMPISKSLTLLNLSSNMISDAGAKALGQALRSNRKLYYLNLSGNKLTDVGAAHIMNSLLDFPLTVDEIIAMKSQYLEFLKKRDEYLERALMLMRVSKEDIGKLTPLLNKTPKPRDKKPKAKVKLVEVTETKEEKALIAKSLIQFGSHDDPFLLDTFVKDGLLWSKGNNTLCFLSLAYNNLSYLTVKKLLGVLKHQKMMNRIPRGILKVLLHGNPMPYWCQEMADIDELLFPKTQVPSQILARRRSSMKAEKKDMSV